MRPFTFPRAERLRLAVVVLSATVSAGACGAADDDRVALKGDVVGFDTLALHPDSLVASVNKPPIVFDSLPRLAEPTAAGSGEGTLVVPGSDGPVGTDAGTEMSRRAQARGDSMARAIAAQMAGTAGGRARADSVRGVLTLVGSEPARQVALKAGDQTIALSGMATTGLSKLVGAEVVVHGVAVTPRDVVVNDYVVRASNGVPAYDGLLEEGGTLRLTDGSGAKRVPLPAELRGVAGARVWVAVKNGAAVAGGVISR